MPTKLIFSPALARSATPDGGWEWYLTIDGAKVLPSGVTRGVLTAPTVTEVEGLRLVLTVWGFYAARSSPPLPMPTP